MLAGLFVLLIAGGALAAGAGYVRTARQMRGFQTTRARVVGRETVALVVFDGGKREARWGSGGGYTPKFTYTYEVGGQTYTNDKWTYATRGYKQAIADQKARDMPEDVEVHYNPADPREA